MKKLTKIITVIVAVLLVAACVVPAVMAAPATVKAGEGVGAATYIADSIKGAVSKRDALGIDDNAAIGVSDSTGSVPFGSANFDKITTEYFSGIVSAEEEGYAGAKYPYTDKTSTQYYKLRIDPSDKGPYITPGFCAKGQAVKQGLVWEFDIMIGQKQLAGSATPDDKSDDVFAPEMPSTGMTISWLNSGGVGDGALYGCYTITPVSEPQDGKDVQFDIGKDIHYPFKAGEWLHLTFVYDISVGEIPQIHAYAGTDEGNGRALVGSIEAYDTHGKRKDVLVEPITSRFGPSSGGYTTFYLDNMISYTGMEIRNPNYLQSFTDTERFIYYVNAEADTAISNSARYNAYLGATELLEIAKASEDAEVLAAVATYEGIGASDIEAFMQAAMNDNAAMYLVYAKEAAAQNVNGSTRGLSNVSKRQSLIDAAKSFLVDVGDLISKNADYEEAEAILKSVEASIVVDNTALQFISAMEKFQKNYELGFVNAMRDCLDLASTYYGTLELPSVYSDKDAKTATYKEKYENYGSSSDFLLKLEREANSKKFIELVNLLYENRDLWETDEKYQRMWSIAYDLTLNLASCDQSVSGFEAARVRFEAKEGPHKFFWNKLQREHVAVISEKLAQFTKEGTTYIEKAGICTYVDYYMADNAKYIDASNAEVFRLVEIAKGYSEQLGTLQESYKELLAQNSRKFVNIVNLAVTRLNYADIKVLVDEAREYYYAMDIPDEETQAAVATFEAMEEYLALVESDCLIFNATAQKLAEIKDEDELYLALVKCYACYDNIDESYDGVTASKAIYDEISYEYNKEVEDINVDVLATAEVVCSVRTYCGIDDIINFVISLFG